MVYGKDVRDWWVGTDAEVQLETARVAWQGKTSSGNAVRVYARTWGEPVPGSRIGQP